MSRAIVVRCLLAAAAAAAALTAPWNFASTALLAKYVLLLCPSQIKQRLLLCYTHTYNSKLLPLLLPASRCCLLQGSLTTPPCTEGKQICLFLCFCPVGMKVTFCVCYTCDCLLLYIYIHIHIHMCCTDLSAGYAMLPVRR
jgi:hypothetical protein